MFVAALVLAGLAAIVHVYIWWLEAPGFRRAGRVAFGVSAEDAEVMRLWAWNQGFYNLFLAVGAGVGIALSQANRDAGQALVVFTTASMLAAALVLILSDRTKARAALVQGLFPALSLAFLLASSLG
ncbi:MAG: DUF1304 domain-containing protein [Pseudonocardia sp.]|nr:DUF1304 domain-containing protein [Pseudonocardia sp.]